MINKKGLYIPLLITIFYIASSINPSYAYKYSGHKWPDSSIPVIYYINENTSDTTGEGAACQAAAQTWSNVPTSAFQFQYGGSATKNVPSYDGVNTLRWGSTGGSIATTYIWYSGERILECDMKFEDNYNWGTDGSSNKMDVQNIATHEFGHFLLLLDLYSGSDSAKTMYGYASTGETKKRTLDPDDIAGISFIYPGNGGSAIVADFSASPRTGYAPLNVQFTDSSTGDINDWLWDFGDGTTSTEQNPYHTYANTGSYMVALDVSGTEGSDTNTKVDYINVSQPKPTPVITMISPDSGSYGTQVTVYGSGFGNNKGRRGYVMFSRRKKAQIISWSDTAIECTVPNKARSGNVKVRNKLRRKSNRYYFTVTK